MGKKAVKSDAGMRRAGEAAAAKDADVHFEVAAVFLCDQIGGGFGCAKEGVKRAVDPAIFGDAVKILGAGVFPTRGKFDERNFVGSVAINFVGAEEKENGFGAMLASGFEEIDGAEGVDFKIENGNVAGFVMGRLRGAVNDEIEAARKEHFVERGAIANIHGVMREIFSRRFEAVEIPEGVAGGAEKFAAHIVVNANDDVALTVQKVDRFGTDKAAAAGDENGSWWHRSLSPVCVDAVLQGAANKAVNSSPHAVRRIE